MFYTARIIALVNCSALLISSSAAIAPHRASFGVPAISIAFAQTGQMDGATAELIKGKTLLRRGRAAEALIRLENALKLFKGAHNKRGEAATHDLLGELYERQGRY
ncbi:MAG TPA: tetratricopeptide repeat protein, partial [Pyrinomonadaceae bacterium]|nr:tetratricopeptide repeat protein [Pyrinomonadaceae bacterium]